LFNTIKNAFIAYLALRMTPDKDGKFMDSFNAWIGLGLYGGDDGVTANVSPATYQKAAAMVGQVMTINEVKHGGLGVKFLARVYSPYVWFGDENSCCDVARTLKKFHVTANLPQDVTPIMKLMEKLRCYSLTDYHTPIIGDMVYRFQKFIGGDIKEEDKTLDIRPYWARFDKSVQYKNEYDDWMYDYIDSVLPEFDHKKFNEWTKEAQTYSQWLRPPCCLEPKAATSAIPAVMGDDIIPLGVQLKPDVPTPEEVKKSSKQNGPYSSWKVPKSDVKMEDLSKNVQQMNVGAQESLQKAESLDKNVKQSIQALQQLPKKEKETFEAMKTRKQKAGTWVEVVPKKKG